MNKYPLFNQSLMPNSNGQGVRYRYGTSQYVMPDMTSGVLCIAGSTCYRNGISEGAALTPASDITTIYLLCRSIGGNPQYYYAGSIQAVAFYNAVLSAGQVSALSTAMAAL